MKLKRMLSGLLSLAMLTGAAAYSPARDAQAADGIVLADTNGAAAIYIDPDGSEYDGISLAADAAAGDIEAVTGQRPEVVYELPESGVVIIAGVVNEEIITNEGLTWEISASNEDIKSEDWERYQIQVKEEEDLTKVIVAGADKRGTVYGLFHITQDLCGVSPWVWWADVRPAHKDVLSFTAEELETVSIRPTVNYRGIFLNNEAPSLSAYVKDRFGNYNYLFYANVCELLLRLKANYLWPAMWGNVFPEEGVLDIDKAKDISNLDKLPESERDNLANERIAEDYGVVISFSHHEPMIRAGLEWQRLQGGGDPVYTKPTENGVPLNEWNYNYNADNIYDFWNDGIERSGGFDNNLITIGMRGEGDSALKNPDGSDMTLQQTVDVLKKAITDQKKISRTI